MASDCPEFSLVLVLENGHEHAHGHGLSCGRFDLRYLYLSGASFIVGHEAGHPFNRTGFALLGQQAFRFARTFLRADFAVGTVYKFFKNKEDLYKSMLMSKAQEFHKILKEVLDTEGDPLSVLRDYVAAKGAIFAENVDSLRLYFAETRGASYNLKAGLDRDIHLLYPSVAE